MDHQSHEGTQTPREMPTGWVIGGTSIGFAMVQLDVSIVNVALPNLGSELGADISRLQWVTDAYALAFAALLLSAGTLSDRLGGRKAYIGGLLGFAAASAICGCVGTIDHLIEGRVLQGIGAAVLVPPSLALLNHACAHDKRLLARAIGIWTAAAGVAVASGPVVGGLLLESLGWRSIFLINLPFCLLGSLIALHMSDTPRKLNRRVDVWGQILAVIMLSSLISSVIKSGESGVYSALSICGALIFAISGLAFIYTESKVTFPMLPLVLFQESTFSAAVFFGWAINLSYYGIIFVVSLYMQQVRCYSPEQAGIAFLPLTATLIFANLFSGWMIGRFGNRPPMVIGALVCSIGFILLLQIDSLSSYLIMLLPFFLIPWGMGIAVPAMTSAMLSSVEKSSAGIASATLNSARQAGGATGVALFGAMIVGGNENIVSGMHTAAVLSASILVIAAVTAWIGIK